MNTLRLHDGRRLAWRETGSGSPLVLLHGWSMSGVVFAEALEAFAGEFRVLAPDLRGHGASDPAEGYAFGDFAADLDAWARALGLDDISLVGWSMGGQTALALHPRLRPRVRRLILVGSTPRFTAGDGWVHGLPDGQVRAMGRDLRRNYLKTMEDFFALQFAGEAMERERYRAIVRFAVHEGRLPDPDVARQALETLRAGDQRAELSAIDVPALVLHGELDRIVPVQAGYALAHALPSAALRILPAAGHAPFLSRPGEVFDIWREFLQ